MGPSKVWLFLMTVGSLSTTVCQPQTLEQFEQTVQQMPTSAAAHSNYALALKSVGRYAEAINEFETAISLEPTYARGYNGLGTVYAALGGGDNLLQAESMHRKAIELMPHLASAHNNLGVVLNELNRPSEAVDVLNEAIRIDPNFAAAHINLGNAYRQLKDGPNAVRASAMGVALQPSSADAHNGLGASLEADSRPAEAAAAFEKALEISPKSSSLHLNLGNALKASGKLQQALSSYGLALQLATTNVESARAYNAMGAALSASGEQDMAARAYSTALELVPSDAIAAANLAKLPAGPVYRKAAAAEVRFLARRAAAVALAKLGAKRAGRSLEALGLVRAGDGDADSLASMMQRTVGYLRLLETGQAPLPASVAHLSQDSGGGDGGGGGLWSLRSAEMPEVLGRLEGGGEAPMTLAAFAWGGVWYHSLMRAFSHPTVRAALVRASRLGGSALVLGSSLGFETYFLALTFGIPSVGVEILSSLVRVSHAVQSEHGVPTSLVSFQCEDALNYRIPSDTAIVYADDTAWDAPALAALAAKLSAELPDGAIVVHNSEHGFASQPAFKLLEVVSVETSWNPSHPVYVHELVRSKKR